MEKLSNESTEVLDPDEIPNINDLRKAKRDEELI